MRNYSYLVNLYLSQNYEKIRRNQPYRNRKSPMPGTLHRHMEESSLVTLSIHS